MKLYENSVWITCQWWGRTKWGWPGEWIHQQQQWQLQESVPALQPYQKLKEKHRKKEADAPSITQGFCRMAEIISMVKCCNLFLMFSQFLARALDANVSVEWETIIHVPARVEGRKSQVYKRRICHYQNLQLLKFEHGRILDTKLFFFLSFIYLNPAPNSEVLSIPLCQWGQQQCWVCQDAKLGLGGSKAKNMIYHNIISNSVVEKKSYASCFPLCIL